MHKRKIRIRNFDKMKSDIYQPFTIAKFKCEYIPIHPFANDAELLKELHMKPEECVNVDAYFRMKKDIYFLSIEKGKPFMENTPNCFVFRDNDETVFMNFYVQHDNPVLTKDFFEFLLKKILVRGVKRIKNMILHQGFIVI